MMTGPTRLATLVVIRTAVAPEAPVPACRRDALAAVPYLIVRGVAKRIARRYKAHEER